jgi:hypothetical protein
MSGGDGGGGSRTFLERLAASERARHAAAQRRQKAAAAQFAGGAGGAAVDPSDPLAARRRAAADAELVARVCSARWGVALPEGADLSKALRSDDLGGADLALAVEAALDEVVESYSKDLLLSDGRRAALLAARGRSKVAGLAAAVRTMEFMERYR